MAEFKYPTETVMLPSKGHFYAEDSPLSKGEVEIKYMTAKEEDILTSTNLIANGTVVDKLMESLIVHEGVTYKDLTTGDATAVLMASRVLAYGKDYPISVTCDQCKETMEHVVDLSQLETPDELVDVDDNGNYSFKTPAGLDVTIKTLTRGEEMKLEKDLKAMENKLGKGTSKEITSRMRSIIVSINGVTDKSELTKMIQNLVIRDSRFIREELKKINPSVDMDIVILCDNCGNRITGGIPIGVDFLWPDA